MLISGLDAKIVSMCICARSTVFTCLAFSDESLGGNYMFASTCDSLICDFLPLTDEVICCPKDISAEDAFVIKLF